MAAKRARVAKCADGYRVTKAGAVLGTYSTMSEASEAAQAENEMARVAELPEAEWRNEMSRRESAYRGLGAPGRAF